MTFWLIHDLFLSQSPSTLLSKPDSQSQHHPSSPLLATSTWRKLPDSAEF